MPSLIAALNAASIDESRTIDPILEQLIEAAAARFQAGEHLDLEQLIAAHPAYADQLRELLPMVESLVRLGDSSVDSAADPGSNGRPATLPHKDLGDFRLIRELGRGGMGTVFEAEQISMGRWVALKVLPFAALARDKSLQRFHNEVRAAAALDHPNIVSVFSVGEERGVHFYAMQLIRGQTLADLIHALRREHKSPSVVPPPKSEDKSGDAVATIDSTVSPTTTKQDAGARINTVVDSRRASEHFQMAARLGIQAAEALQHAHDLGVLHRDIKPGNLMLDSEGKLYVTDFGLARIEADAGLTMTGDIIGTLRYMAPEQALAKRVVIDQRADVYSLGATLYELLTLQPAFGETDRSELLKQIAFEEPPPLRKLDRHIPVELETIVLKAMAKSPDERYQTGQRLADDLLAYLEHRPIKAQPANLLRRVAKWTRRNSTQVAAAALVMGISFVLAVASVVIVGGAWANARDAQRRTVTERDRFLNERDTALHNLYVADVRLAHQEWNNSHLASFDKLLDAHIPAQGQPDDRGWEWYYLKSLGQRELATLSGHTANVSSVAWSPDGRLLASGSDDFTVKVWDAATWQERATLRGHTERVRSVGWSPDGLRLASSAADDTLRVWDLASQMSILTIPADCSTRSVVWNPEGTKLASCGISPDKGEGLTKIWDVRTGQELLRMKGPSGLVFAVAWSPDGKQLASAGNYDVPHIRIWDADTGRQLREIADISRGVAVVALDWSPDGTGLAAATQRDDVEVRNTQDWGRKWRTPAHPGGITCVDWSPNGGTVASVGRDGTVKLWNNKGEIENTLRGHRAAVNSVDWRFDSQRLATASADNTIKIWKPDSDQMFKKVDAFNFAGWYPSSGHSVAVVNEGGADDLLQLQILSGTAWNTRQNTPLPFKKTDFQSPNEINWAWSSDVKQFAFGWASKDAIIVRILEGATGARVTTLADPFDQKVSLRTIRQMEWSPVAPLLAVAIAEGGAIVWDVAAGKKVAKLTNLGVEEGDVGVDSVAWSPDGSRLAITSWDQNLSVFETQSWREVVRLNRQPDAKESDYGGQRMVAWSPDGRVLAAGTARGWVIIWETTSWRELLTFSAHTAPVRSIAISPDGHRLVTASRDGTVKIWDANDGQQLLTLPAHDRSVDRVSWSPDGTCLLTTTFDTARTENRIWDASAALPNQQDKETKSPGRATGR